MSHLREFYPDPNAIPACDAISIAAALAARDREREEVTRLTGVRFEGDRVVWPPEPVAPWGLARSGVDLLAIGIHAADRALRGEFRR